MGLLDILSHKVLIDNQRKFITPLDIYPHIFLMIRIRKYRWVKMDRLLHNDELSNQQMSKDFLDSRTHIDEWSYLKSSLELMDIFTRIFLSHCLQNCLSKLSLPTNKAIHIFYCKAKRNIQGTKDMF